MTTSEIQQPMPDQSDLFSCAEHSQHIQITLHPSLNEAGWSDIEAVGNTLIAKVKEKTKPKVLVDLRQLDMLNSSVVALIVRIWKSLKEVEGKMVVVNHNETVFQVLQLAGLDTVWTIVGNDERAYSELGVKRPRNDGKAEGVVPETAAAKVGLSFLVIFALVGVVAIVSLAVYHFSK